MKPTLLLPALVLAVATGLAFAPATGHAANADNPYGNVDHRNDAGNDTGIPRSTSSTPASSTRTITGR